MEHSESLHAVGDLPAAHSSATAALSRAGVAIWLEGGSPRELLAQELGRLVADYNVVGVIKDPRRLASRVLTAGAYDELLVQRTNLDVSILDTAAELVVTEAAESAELLISAFHQSGGRDGRVSVDIAPAVAYRAKETFERASHLWASTDQPNLMVKIAATAEGIDAIAEAVAAGISVNVTLLSNVNVYRLAIRAYFSGLERALLAGRSIGDIFSVASFQISQVDREVDVRLIGLDTPDASELRNTFGLANARLAYRVFQEEFSRPRAQRLLERGANVQRLLWSSTSVEDTDLPDTYYVDDLIAPDTVLAMSSATVRAFADHGRLSSDTVTDRYADALDTFERLKAVGVSYEKATDKVLADGVDHLQTSWQKLNSAVTDALRSMR